MMTKQRHTIIASVYLVLIKDSCILMGIRTNTGYNDGNYGLVSGHVESNESLIAAMIREAQEEAGIVLTPENLILSHVMHRKEADERLDFFFTASQWTGTITNMEPLKCKGWEWIDSHNPPKNVIQYLLDAITYIKNTQNYSQRGWKNS